MLWGGGYSFSIIIFVYPHMPVSVLSIFSFLSDDSSYKPYPYSLPIYL